MTTPLIYIGVIVYQGCTSLFEKEHVMITKNNQHVASGTRNHQTGLWNMELQQLQEDHLQANHLRIVKQQHANYITPTSNMHEMIKYLHAASFPLC